MPATIDISEVTNSTDTTAGTGIFDVLIQSVERRIDSQFNQGRLAGTDYANVYLGSMQAVLQESMKFILGEQLAEAQIDQVREKTVAESFLAQATLEKQWGFTVTQDATTKSLIDDITTATGGEIDEKITKLIAEQGLIDQKTVTELGQTSDSAASPFGTGSNPLLGVMGAQQELYKHQSAAFYTKADVDKVKAMNDVWSVAFSINDGASPSVPGAITGSTFNTEISNLASTDRFSGI